MPASPAAGTTARARCAKRAEPRTSEERTKKGTTFWMVMPSSHADNDTRPERRAKEGPLTGIRVLDFSRVLAGPYCTALLADLGAAIIKVEPPAGDDYRFIGPKLKDRASALFQTVNRGKRGITLDLKDENHLRVARELARHADVLVENFRPGVAEKLGIGWGRLAPGNPRLIYASISGFGQDGERARAPAYDIIIQAMSGIMAITGDPAGPPTLIGESIADVISGLFASWAILAALVERNRTGRGRRIDVAMLDAMLAVQPLIVARYLATGETPGRVGNRHALSAPFGVFAARDGQFVLAVLNDKLFATLTRVIARPDLSADPRFQTDALRNTNEERLRHAIEEWSGRLSAHDAVSTLTAAGVPAAEIQDTVRALAVTEAAGRPALQSVLHPELGPLQVPEQPVRFAGVPRGGLFAAPRLGEHTKRVLEDPARAWDWA